MSKTIEGITPINLNIAIIGAGRVGTTIAYILASKKLPNLKIISIASRSNNSIERARKILNSITKEVFFTRDNSKAASLANCVIISTPDDVIERVCRELFINRKIGQKGDKLSDQTISKDYIVIHMSGSKPLEVLKYAEERGAVIASIHPLKSFASIEEAINTMPGTVFGITCKNPKAESIATYIVQNLGGSVIKVDNQKKPLYHAAACVASNYLVSLLNYASFIHEKIGINPNDSLKGLVSLAQGTVENIKKMGTKKSLTGPIARGDIGTIKEHLESFDKCFEKNEVTPYKVMGVETAKIAYLNGWIDENVYKNLLELLKAGEVERRT